MRFLATSFHNTPVWLQATMYQPKNKNADDNIESATLWIPKAQ
jgi:hypothetical protein